MKVSNLLLPSFLLARSTVVSSSYGDPHYEMTDSIAGRDFYNFFDWEAISDPTHGRV